MSEGRECGWVWEWGEYGRGIVSRECGGGRCGSRGWRGGRWRGGG